MTQFARIFQPGYNQLMLSIPYTLMYVNCQFMNAIERSHRLALYSFTVGTLTAITFNYIDFCTKTHLKL